MAVLTLAVRHDHFSYCQMMEETDMCKGERESGEMASRGWGRGDREVPKSAEFRLYE